MMKRYQCTQDEALVFASTISHSILQKLPFDEYKRKRWKGGHHAVSESIYTSLQTAIGEVWDEYTTECAKKRYAKLTKELKSLQKEFGETLLKEDA